MVITSKAPNRDGAHKFINFLLEAKIGAQNSNYINYASPNAQAMPDISPEARKDPRIYPTADQIKKLEYLQDVGKDTALYDEVWTSIKAK
jgi:spermidine/putrescine transport system substrate-binding protein